MDIVGIWMWFLVGCCFLQPCVCFRWDECGSECGHSGRLAHMVSKPSETHMDLNIELVLGHHWHRLSDPYALQVTWFFLT